MARKRVKKCTGAYKKSIAEEIFEPDVKSGGLCFFLNCGNKTGRQNPQLGKLIKTLLGNSEISGWIIFVKVT